MTTGTPIQTQYNVYQQAGWPGALSRPNEPHAFHHGVLRVPSAATRTPRPGDPVYWDSTNNRFALPTTEALRRQAVGILSFDSGTVQAAQTLPTDANSDAFVEFKDGSRVKVCVMGTLYVVAGSALEYDDLVEWNLTDFDWTLRAAVVAAGNTTAQINAAFEELRQKPMVCVSREAVADEGLAEVQIGYGRVY